MTEFSNDATLPMDVSATPVVRLLELGAHFALAERAGRMGYWRHQLGEAQPHWSPGLFAILGLNPNEVRPSDEFLIERIHPDDRAVVLAGVTAARKMGKAFCYRSRSWNDGQPERVFETHGDVERAADGRIVALLGVVREVTSEVAAERAL